MKSQFKTIVLRMQGASELEVDEAPGLHAVVAELAAAAGIPKPGRIHRAL